MSAEVNLTHRTRTADRGDVGPRPTTHREMTGTVVPGIWLSLNASASRYASRSALYLGGLTLAGHVALVRSLACRTGLACGRAGPAPRWPPAAIRQWLVIRRGGRSGRSGPPGPHRRVALAPRAGPARGR